jgi:5'-methylthioadenosine phosphorylase
MIGIIGGSGIYDIDGLTGKRWIKAESAFGEPSDEILVGQLGEAELAFLPRHRRGHVVSPSEINFRANIDALKRLGVTDILAVSAVGSLRENLPPGTFVIVDQFIDRTVSRERSFFGTGFVAHVGMADPVCSRLGDHVENGARAAGISAVRGGTYLVVEGPQFSTRAESELYRSWGAHVIGMTNMPEARLAREAEICYASVSMVTDFDCWHDDHDTVTVDAIVKVLLANADRARSLIKSAAPLIAADAGADDCSCRHALDHAIVTSPDARDASVAARLDAVAGRLLNKR